MAIFFFETLYDGRLHEDHEGIDLHDLAEAKVQASQLLCDMSYDNDPAAVASVLTCDVLDVDRRIVYRATMRCDERPAPGPER